VVEMVHESEQEQERDSSTWTRMSTAITKLKSGPSRKRSSCADQSTLPLLQVSSGAELRAESWVSSTPTSLPVALSVCSHAGHRREGVLFQEGRMLGRQEFPARLVDQVRNNAIEQVFQQVHGRAAHQHSNCKVHDPRVLGSNSNASPRTQWDRVLARYSRLREQTPVSCAQQCRPLEIRWTLPPESSQN
jgi:hypothetical protein